MIEVYSICPSLVIYGYNQLIFDKRKALLIDKNPMDCFLNPDESQYTFDFKESYLEGIEMNIEPPLKLKEWYEKNYIHFVTIGFF